MKRFITFLIAIIMTISLTACGDGLTNTRLRKILAENGYQEEMIKSTKSELIIYLKENVEGLEKSKYNKLVLLSFNNKYAFTVINTDTKKMTDIAFGYIPLNVVQQYIWSGNKDINIKDCNIAKKYIETYGIHCFENKEYAEKYLREITGENGILPTSTAKDLISKATTQIFPDITSADEITVLFEEGSAVPKYYTTESTTMVYNWQHVMPEFNYDVWKAGMDRQSLKFMESMYGPPYIAKTVWAVVDSDLNEVGTYDTLEEVERKLLHTNESESKP